MNVIKRNYAYLDDIEILIRVYNNQNKNSVESEQCVGEILFKSHLNKDSIRVKAWLPKGLAEFINKELKLHYYQNKKIQISNELNNTIGVLTSCRTNFDMLIN